MGKPILCLDFDGVIHSYESGWQGAGVCSDPPVPGTLEYLHEATKHYRVMVYSSRSKSLAGRRAMKRYLREHFAVALTFSPDHSHDWLHEEIELPWFKPPAFISIDDRALTFTGNWQDFNPAALRDFKPWNKRAQAIEARRAETQSGSVADESAVATGDAPNSPAVTGSTAQCASASNGSNKASDIEAVAGGDTL